MIIGLNNKKLEFDIGDTIEYFCSDKKYRKTFIIKKTYYTNNITGKKKPLYNLIPYGNYILVQHSTVYLTRMILIEKNIFI